MIEPSSSEDDLEIGVPKPKASKTSKFTIEIPNISINKEDYPEITEDDLEYAYIAKEGVPSSYKETLKSPEQDEWKQAMDRELAELDKQNTWTLVKKPADRKVLKGKWVYALKTTADNKPKYKARWVAKGFQQIPGLDFNEVFASTVNPVTYRIILAIAASKDWEIQQWDIKNAFPNASISEEIYVIQPTGFEKGGPEVVCKLNKALYGLKQAAREWQ
ncbi:hypothetical protein DV735_g5979, partial [Chaetothyriales sp. CBS 134920]